MKFEVYKSNLGLLSQQWRWRLVAANNKTIADSAEGYTNKIDCEHGVDLVKQTGFYTPVVYLN